MKVLFVCRNNTGRSQVAMELFKSLGGQAESAGTDVLEPGQKMRDRPGAKIVIDAMKEYDIDMSENIREQVTPEMTESFDKIIVMAELGTVPAWLQKNPKAEMWEVPDIKGEPIETARQIRDQIKHKVEALAEEL